ncbi:MAG: hypothetical protein V3R98_01335 [Alphaproteobacteria bacterium]
MAKDLMIGITEGGVLHTDTDPPLDLDTRFRMVRDAGVFDYYDKTPPADQVDDYLRCSEKYGLPVRAGGWFYTLGSDEALLEQNLRIGAALGSKAHNTQIMSHHADGHLITDQEVADSYLRAYEIGESVGCVPTFEVHVNMWSEDFRRVSRVGDLVAARGAPFRMTLDHSHVIFKIDNPDEQEVFDIRGDVDSGALVLDPFSPGNVCDEWIDRGYVCHAHARAAVPANPTNIWGKHPDGSVGRGIQYPFIQPGAGEYHSPWQAERLEPWKEIVRHLMTYHATHDDSPLGQISTEFIPNTDYGEGGKYSIFDNSVACAAWLRQTWDQTVAAA